MSSETIILMELKEGGDGITGVFSERQDRPREVDPRAEPRSTARSQPRDCLRRTPHICAPVEVNRLQDLPVEGGKDGCLLHRLIVEDSV